MPEFQSTLKQIRRRGLSALRRRFARRDAGTVADPEDVRIDRDRRLAKGNVEHDVCGFPADPGQGFERLGYAESFFGPSRAVAEETFDVLGETGKAEMQVDLGAKSAKERAPFLAIETCSFLGNPGELIVRSAPIEVFGALREVSTRNGLFSLPLTSGRKQLWEQLR